MTAPTDPSPAPGWYPDPGGASALRWWDGQQWTTHIHQPHPTPPPPPSNDGLKWVLPIGRSGLAIAAGYLGLLAVLMVPAPFAVATGIGALVAIKRHPEKSGRGRAIFGIVMGGVFTVIFVIALLSQ